ncbi:ATP-binding cassette domain-containing protein, partial [Ramlibacter sp. H39-3-26]|uniref:ATP-binding cassette domain-containing protein n=1 Tax=Curvibacter soli TaxID=3031331 RepID=UPI0023DCB961
MSPVPPDPDPHAGAQAGAGDWLQVAAALVWLPQAALVALGIDRIAQGGGLRAVLLPALAVAALGAVRAGIDAWGVRRAFRAARAAVSRLRADAALALAGRSPIDIRRAASGQAASVIGEQADMVTAYLARYRPAQRRAAIVPLAIVLAVAPLSWLAALILLVAAPLIPLFMALVGMRAQAASRAQMVEMGGMNAFLLDRLRGLATLRALGAVDATAQALRASAESLRARTMAVLRIAFLSSAVLELFSALGVALVAVYVGFHLLGHLGFGAWGVRLSLAQGLFVLLLAPAFFEPLRDLSAAWHDKAAGQAAMAALRQLAERGTELPGGRAQAVEAPLAARAGAVAVDVQGLCFHHAGAAAPVVDGFSLHVRPGERVALVGTSGVGKSTLLALLAGLAPAQAGRIAIDGVALTPATAQRLRARMAWVGQKPHVFAGTLEANVALGRPQVDAARAGAALRFAALDAVAARHAGAVLGEGGTGLSG